MLGGIRMNLDTITTQEETENEYHERQKAKWREYDNRPKVKARKKIHNSSLKVKEYKHEYWQKPKVKQRKNELNKEPKNQERNQNHNLFRYYLKSMIKQSYRESIQDIVNSLEGDRRKEEEYSIRLGIEALSHIR